MEKQVKQKSVFQGVIFHVSKDEVVLEDGRKTRRDVVHHHGGVAVLAMRNQKVLLVQQYRYAVQQDLWELPAGKLEQEEDPLACGLRELEEETGYRGSEANLLTSFYSTPGFCDERIYLYRCTSFEKVDHPLPMDEHEQINTAWFSLEDAYQMIKDGRICDAKTIIGIQQAILATLEKAAHPD